MTERARIVVPQEIDTVIHHFSDKELSEHLKAYDICRDIFAAVALAGVGLIASADKIPAPVAYIDGVLAVAVGYWMMETWKQIAREAVAEARARGLKVVETLFARKLDIQDKAT